MRPLTRPLDPLDGRGRARGHHEPETRSLDPWTHDTQERQEPPQGSMDPTPQPNPYRCGGGLEIAFRWLSEVKRENPPTHKGRRASKGGNISD